MWLSIDDVYSVSIDGQVKKNARLMKGATDSTGYRQVSHYGKLKLLHHLVASRFLPQPTDEKVEIDHIDRDKSNNHASNLRWCNRSVNSRNRNHKLSSITGEQYISEYILRNGNIRYVFCIQRHDLKYKEYFKTLEEAVSFKNKFFTPE
jgi:hypothetical protein